MNSFEIVQRKQKRKREKGKKKWHHRQLKNEKDIWVVTTFWGAKCKEIYIYEMVKRFHFVNESGNWNTKGIEKRLRMDLGC